MPIAANLGALTLGTRLASALTVSPETVSAPPPAPSPATPAAALPPPSVVTPPVLNIAPTIRPPLPITTMPPLVPPTPVVQAPVTALARGAIAQLNAEDPANVAEAIRTIRNQQLTAETLMDYLERKVRIGEVLGNRAAQWSDTTRTDFAGQNGAFQMPAGKTDVMDAIVSVAILNDRNLEADIRGENTKEITQDDLLQNRLVKWQWPPAGTVLAPPYVVVVAVDYREVATADSVVSSILDQLGVYQGFKLPKAIIQKL